VNDEQKPEDNKETVEQPAAEPAPVPAAPAAPDANETAEQPAAETKVVSTPRTRRILLTSGAGLALAGGVIGFGIGHATADGGDGDRFRPTSQTVPGEGGRDFGNGERPDGPPNGFGDRDQSGDGSGNQQSNGDNDPT
jgi:hypothetical protein